MTIDAADWYDSSPDPIGFFQGDILERVPVVFMPPAGSGKWVLLRPSFPVTLEQALGGNTPKVFRPFVAGTAPEEWKAPDELVLAKATRRAIMVITQTCDLERRNSVQVAPVYPARSLSENKQASLEKNEVNYLFYLPMAEPGLSEKSFADLSQITSVHTSYVREAKLAKRLSNEGRARLQMHLANLHGRPFGFSAKDNVSQGGEYLCLRCFLAAAVVEKKSLNAGTTFGDCGGCGPEALWIKFN
jgi:hypothetical protein